MSEYKKVIEFLKEFKTIITTKEMSFELDLDNERLRLVLQGLVRKGLVRKEKFGNLYHYGLVEE